MHFYFSIFVSYYFLIELTERSDKGSLGGAGRKQQDYLHLFSVIYDAALLK